MEQKNSCGVKKWLWRGLVRTSPGYVVREEAYLPLR